MVDLERAKDATLAIIQQYHNMAEFQSAEVSWYEGDRVVLLTLKYATDYPFTNKIFEVLVVKNIVGQSNFYI